MLCLLQIPPGSGWHVIYASLLIVMHSLGEYQAVQSFNEETTRRGPLLVSNVELQEATYSERKK